MQTGNFVLIHIYLDNLIFNNKIHRKIHMIDANHILILHQVLSLKKYYYDIL